MLDVLQINGPESREESLEEMASDFVDLEEKRTDLIWQFEEHLGSGERRIFGKRVTTGEYRNWRKKRRKVNRPMKRSSRDEQL